MKLIYSGETKNTENKLVFEKRNVRTLCVYTKNTQKTYVMASQNGYLYSPKLVHLSENITIAEPVEIPKFQWNSKEAQPYPVFKYQDKPTWRPNTGNTSGGSTGGGSGTGDNKTV